MSPTRGVIQRHVWVSGRVQGVGFRAATVAEAQRRGLRGWVKNLPDGRVEAVFGGEEEPVLAMVAWCREGPPAARVSALEVQEESMAAALPDFNVLR